MRSTGKAHSGQWTMPPRKKKHAKTKARNAATLLFESDSRHNKPLAGKVQRKQLDVRKGTWKRRLVEEAYAELGVAYKEAKAAAGGKKKSREGGVSTLVIKQLAAARKVEWTDEEVARIAQGMKARRRKEKRLAALGTPKTPATPGEGAMFPGLKFQAAQHMLSHKLFDPSEEKLLADKMRHLASLGRKFTEADLGPTVCRMVVAKYGVALDHPSLKKWGCGKLGFPGPKFWARFCADNDFHRDASKGTSASRVLACTHQNLGAYGERTEQLFEEKNIKMPRQVFDYDETPFVPFTLGKTNSGGEAPLLVADGDEAAPHLVPTDKTLTTGGITSCADGSMTDIPVLYIFPTKYKSQSVQISQYPGYVPRRPVLASHSRVLFSLCQWPLWQHILLCTHDARRPFTAGTSQHQPRRRHSSPATVTRVS